MGKGKRTRRPPPPMRLSRRAAVRQPKLALVIFCEGERTEPEYLEALKRDYGNGLVHIKVEPAAGVPVTLVEKALTLKKERRARSDGLAAGDQIWVVFDCDEHEHVAHSRTMAEAGGVRVAYSNPCFELWAYLHFADYDAPVHRHDIQSILEKKMVGYDANRGKSLNYDVMRQNFPDAEKRAIAMRGRRKDENNERGNPYTDVDILARLIMDNGKLGN